MLLIFLTFLFLPFLADSCLETPTKCPCPAVRYIDQIGIANLEYGSYLANRTTTRPRVTVTDECQIVADVSELDTPNHYLMVFREGAPPIFAKRLSNDTDKIIQLSDITCVRLESEYVWEYYGGVISNLSVTVQSNEEWCSCDSAFIQFYSDVNVTYLTCDKFAAVIQPSSEDSLTASFDSRPGAGHTAHLAISQTYSLVVDDLMCVDGQWYYNNYVVPTENHFNLEFEPPFHCGCFALDYFPPEYSPDLTGAYANYTFKRVVSSYNDDSCSVNLQCANPNDTLVIPNYGYKTLSYPPGTKLSMSCASSPLSSSSDSPKFWYVDGVMVNDPRVACYSNTCPCSFAFLGGTFYKDYIGNHPSLENITSKYNIESSYPFPEYMITNNACPGKMYFFSTGYIIFDKTTATVLENRNEVAISCSSVTKRWTVEGQEFEQLYVVGYFRR